MPKGLEALRRRAVGHSLRSFATVAEAASRLGLVQADPIRAPARAQDLILRQRVRGYRAGDLEARYPASGLEEEWLHVYGFMTVDTVNLLHPRPVGGRVDRENPGLAERLLEYVGERGEVHHRELERHFGRTSARSGWGRHARATTLLLEMLHYGGRLRVARREGNDRYYVLAPPRRSDLSPGERLRRLVRLLVGLYAPVTGRTLGGLVSRLRHVAPTLTATRAIVKEMTAAGELESAAVDGVRYLWLAGEPAPGTSRPRVRLLAPFDPVVWDRVRFEHLWGWPYRFEAYTPAAKRRWGYYALPLLWRDEVIGWANVRVDGGGLHVDTGFVHGPPSDPRFRDALDREIESFRAFLGAG